MAKMLTEFRTKWFARSVFIGLAIAFVVSLTTGSGAKIPTGRLGGDFPAFYGAGRIVLSGEIDQLYTLQRQIRAQRDLYDREDVGFLPFAYPPVVAYFYSYFARLPYRISFAVHSLLVMTAMVLGLFFLKKFNRTLQSNFKPALAGCLLFYPLFRANINGQNTAVTLMLIALVMKWASEERHVIAGVALGLLFYKPQFAVPLVGLFFIARRYKTFFSALILLGLQLFANHLIYGSKWLRDWSNFVSWFGPADALNNNYNAVSWLGFAKTVGGQDNRLVLVTGFCLIVFTVLYISWVWYKSDEQVDFSIKCACAAACLVLMPPHVMFYDVGLVLVVYAMILDRMEDNGRVAFMSVWLFAFTQLLAPLLGFSPLFFLALFTLVLAEKCRRQATTNCC